MSDPPFTWQLHVFSLVHALGAVFLYGLAGDPCALWTGTADKCNKVEAFTVRMMGFEFLYVGVLVFVLTMRNKADAPKLRRLAAFGAHAAAAIFAGIIMTGSSRMGGTERSSFHFGDMICSLALFCIMAWAVADDKTMAGPTSSPLTGLGVNCKALLLLVVVILVLKLFAMTDFINYTYMFEDGNGQLATQLGRQLWGWLAIIMFEVLLVVVFALAYGNDKDHEDVTIAIVVMTIVSALTFFPNMGHVKAGLLKQSIISMIVWIILCLLAVAGGRMQQRRSGSGYEQAPLVESTNV